MLILNSWRIWLCLPLSSSINQAGRDKTIWSAILLLRAVWCAEITEWSFSQPRDKHYDLLIDANLTAIRSRPTVAGYFYSVVILLFSQIWSPKEVSVNKIKAKIRGSLPGLKSLGSGLTCATKQHKYIHNQFLWYFSSSQSKNSFRLCTSLKSISLKIFGRLLNFLSLWGFFFFYRETSEVGHIRQSEIIMCFQMLRDALQD